MPARKPADLQALLRDCPEAKILLDGTERPIQRPKHSQKQKSHYIGKKKRHTVKNIVAVSNKSKKIIALGETKAGSQHDKKATDEENYDWPKGIGICQDSGFQGYTPKGVKTYQPKKKPRGGQLCEEEKLANRKLNRDRVVVEHAIGRVKVYKIVREVNRNRRCGFQDSVMETACGLANWKIRPVKVA